MRTNNKVRANRWEREASRMLSLWVSQGRRSDWFWRTNSSGAMGTVTGERKHAGDIVAIDPASALFGAMFHIEAKWKRDFDYADLGTIKKWLSIEGGKAKELKKALLMLIKGRNGEVYVMVEAGRRNELVKRGVPVPLGERLVFQGFVVFRAVKK